MISKGDIKNLAELSRMDISEVEAEKLGTEIDSILEYVGQVQTVSLDIEDGIDFGPVKNIFREDEPEPSQHREELIAEFPDKEGDYLKVNKIL